MANGTMLLVGLGQIGTSIGLALKANKHPASVIGFSKDARSQQRAKSIGAVDRTAKDLATAAREADIVVLAVPVDQAKDMLATIGPELKDGALILDTSPARLMPTAWAKENLSEGHNFLGFTPVLNPQALHSPQGGAAEASEALFEDGMFVITSPLKASSEAIDAATQLAYQIGAQPLFADEAEVDSYMAFVHVLPQVVAAGLSNITLENAGWQELRKVAGRPYAQLTNLVDNMDTPEAISTSAQSNRANMLRALDTMIAELRAMRDELADEQGEAFDARIARATEGRRQWWVERQEAEWLLDRSLNPEVQDAGGINQLFGIGRRGKKQK